MLSSVHIENIALIERLDLELDGGFSVFTGETGAGKSIIIDSIGLILGARGERELVRTGTDGAVVEAMFTDISDETASKLKELGAEPDEDGCIFIRRTLSPDGKGSAKIGTRTVPVSLLREISPYLVNIHGQHHNSVLLRSEQHLGILDDYGDAQTIKNEYLSVYNEFRLIEKEQASLNMDAKEKARRIEMLRFQINELKSAKLKVGEEEILLSDRKRLRNYEKIAVGASTVYDRLYGDNGSATESIDKALAALRTLEGVLPEAAELYSKLDEYRYEIEDIAERVKDAADTGDEDPETALDKIEERLELISKLKKKYGSTEAEMLEYLAKCEDELSGIELSDIRAEELSKKLSECEKRLCEKAQKLSEHRHTKALELSKLVEKELCYLDMNGVKFSVEFSQTGYTQEGKDFAEFYVSTNPGEPGKPVGKIASGGELARIMLAIKSVLSEKDSVETMIYDEVDTGVSGKTSRKIGERLRHSAKGKQVLCVTHSAQIASLANTHYLVSKKTTDGRTATSIYPLSGDERIEETARIIAGIDITEAARNSARELIEGAVD